VLVALLQLLANWRLKGEGRRPDSLLRVLLELEPPGGPKRRSVSDRAGSLRVREPSSQKHGHRRWQAIRAAVGPARWWQRRRWPRRHAGGAGNPGAGFKRRLQGRGPSVMAANVDDPVGRTRQGRLLRESLQSLAWARSPGPGSTPQTGGNSWRLLIVALASRAVTDASKSEAAPQGRSGRMEQRGVRATSGNAVVALFQPWRAGDSGSSVMTGPARLPAPDGRPTHSYRCRQSVNTSKSKAVGNAAIDPIWAKPRPPGARAGMQAFGLGGHRRHRPPRWRSAHGPPTG